ncbi:Small-conductance mechanosensitive channel [Polystyrenella longa]|uniref:Small-conductance mechanosensitive channel n=1 Tax=Polystyrenella longa TaxID=2528007 RepID=A0A518CMW5_9PLAN|nr:mechanosensitive ion channel domain-containing protein [Polystyrenella longa]QDU80567.1 Small-conductance mechanosensitive channel [Polystyrenella longa]
MTSILFSQLLAQADGPDRETAGSLRTVDMWNEFVEYALENGPELLLSLVTALLIFVVGRWIAKILVHLSTNVMTRSKVDQTLARFLTNILYIALLAMIILASLEQLGINTMSFTAVLATAGLAVGLALKDSLSNFASGVMLIIFKPFSVGQFVEAGGTDGVVEEIHIFHTKLRSGDNKAITVPNSSITDGVIINYSSKPTRRIDMVVGCGYDDDLRAVRNFLEEVIASDSRILPDPAPVIAVNELADSCINFVVRPWVMNADYWVVKWELNEKIKNGFDQRGFSIPYPQRDVHIHNVES